MSFYFTGAARGKQQQPAQAQQTSPPGSPSNAQQQQQQSPNKQQGSLGKQQSGGQWKTSSKFGSFAERPAEQGSAREGDPDSPKEQNRPSYLSRYTSPEEPVISESSDWVRKSSRQRRFTQTSLPSLHERERIAREEMDYDDSERDQVLQEMSGHMDDMSGFVSSIVQRKEEDLKFMAEMFDEDGNPIVRYDEDGNPIPFRDEDGHSLDGWDRQEEDNKKANMVTIDTAKMSMKEGWLWKKGSGAGAFGRTNWTRRYFKFDMAQVITVYYFRNQMPQCTPQRESETKELYQKRKRIFFNQQKEMARGYIRLMYASLEVPDQLRRHRNPNINPAWEFDVVIPNSRTFRLCAESQEDFEKWVQTIGYITSTIDGARRQLNKNKRVPRTLFDEVKRDAALNCTAFGKGLFEAVAGHPSEFFIQGYDFANGMPATEGGLRFTAVMESRDLHYDLDIFDMGDGTYRVTYTPTRVGTYELSIMLDDYDIKGSPFHPSVRPAPVSAPHCVADGAGLFCAVLGAVNRFTVQTRNAFNQIIVARGVPFEVYLSPPLMLCNSDGSPIEPGQEYFPKDNGNGTYSVAYIVDPKQQLLDALNRGDHVEGEIVVQLDDKIHNPSFPRTIKGAPFRPVLAASATGAALASAARHAAMILGGAEYAELLNSFNNGMGGFSNGNNTTNMESKEQDGVPLLRAIPTQQQRMAKSQQYDNSFMQQQQPEYNEEEEDGGGIDEFSSFRLRHQPNQQQSFSQNQQQRYQTSFGSEPSSSMKSSNAEYLPVRRRRRSDPNVNDSFQSSSSSRRQQPNSGAGLSPEQQDAIEAERDQLLRLRRELQEGKHQVEEQVGRIAVVGKKVQDDSQRMLNRFQQQPSGRSDDYVSSRSQGSPSSYAEAPPPPPPYQYVRAASNNNTMSPPSRSPPSQARSATTARGGNVRREETNNVSSPAGIASYVSPSSSSPPVFDGTITAMFNRHVQPLKRVFRHYAVREESTGMDVVRLPGFTRCCTDFDITPTFASKKEIRDAFELASSMGQGALDFPEFVNALGHVAINALGKPMFANLYTTSASRIAVLLGMWGLGDQTIFDGILQRERYVRG